MTDFQDTLKEFLISSIEGAGNRPKQGAADQNGSGDSHAVRRVATGLGAAALAPVALKGLGRLAKEAGMDGVQELVKSPGKTVQGLGGNLGKTVGSNLAGGLSDKVDEAGGPGGLLSDTIKDALPFGSSGGNSGGGLGVGKGRRMPVQQSIEIGAPLETVYNQWTQFETWPEFMHRVVRVTQEDECTVTFEVKIWTRTREFTAEIETQRPDDVVQWKVSQGITHAGVVSFHELAPNLTRVLLSIDVQPGGLIEKMARGMRHVKRAVRGDLHRFKAFIEMSQVETGAWRGVIEEGELVEAHDPKYDQKRDYADVDDVLDTDSENDSERESKDEDEDEQPRSRRRGKSSKNGHGPDEGSSRTRKSRSTNGSSSSRRTNSAPKKSGSSASSRSSSSGSSSSGSSKRASSGNKRSRSSGSSPSPRRARAQSRSK
jgi:uncharacterized membrane protein